MQHPVLLHNIIVYEFTSTVYSKVRTALIDIYLTDLMDDSRA